MLTTITPPRFRIVAVPCDKCNGTCKEVREWDICGAPVAFGVCTSCLGRGVVRINAPITPR